MTNDDAAKIAKLPKWARRIIERLEHALDEERDRTRLATVPGASKVRGDWIVGGKFVEIGLPYDKVLFYPDLKSDRSFEVRCEGRELNVRVAGRCSAAIAVVPQAGNVIRVRHAGWEA